LIEVQFESTSGAYRILEGRVRNTEAPPAPPRGAGRGAAGRGAPAVPPPPPPRHGTPRGYKVEVSSDARTWKTVAEGKDAWHNVMMLSSGGTGVQESIATTAIPFAPVTAKFVRITQTETTENPPVWSIQSLRLYEAGK
jgi:F5/8 type C domain-containing protein